MLRYRITVALKILSVNVYLKYKTLPYNREEENRRKESVEMDFVFMSFI